MDKKPTKGIEPLFHGSFLNFLNVCVSGYIIHIDVRGSRKALLFWVCLSYK